MSSLSAGAIVRVAGGFMKMAEGPLWWPEEGCLVVSDIVGDASWKVWPDGRYEPFRQPSEHCNGRTWGLHGHMLTAEHVTRQVTHLVDGQYLPLATRYDGKRFNSPNDVIVASWGEAFISDPPFGLDPPYGSHHQEPEIGFNGVYAFDLRTGDARLIHDGFKYPNGIALSPDETRLYVNDSATNQIWVWDVSKGATSNGRFFADGGKPGAEGVVDGLKVDELGNVYCTAPGRTVAIFSSQGDEVDRIVFPEQPAACAWGGADYRTLYVAAETSVYSLPMAVRGVGSGIKGSLGTKVSA